MRTLWIYLFALLTFTAAPVGAQTYDELKSETAELRVAQSSDVDLTGVFDALTQHWMGTTWGLGLPQSDTPGVGKINCGTFVGTILSHLGVNVNVKKLQRQPSELIIKTFVRGRDIVRFRNRPTDEFVARVAALGDGVYIIGLDFHVGFLRVRDGEVRFVHASYVTHTVVDELASEAEPIRSSKYRVVGKIFDAKMMRDWRAGRRIPVVGNW